MKKFTGHIFSLLFLFFNLNTSAQIIPETTHKLVSPDNNIVVNFFQKKLSDSTRSLHYSVDYKGKSVIAESDLDVQLDNHLCEQAMALPVDHHVKWCENLKVIGSETNSNNSVWKPLIGEQSEIKDNYNSLIIHLVKDDNPIYKMDLEIRAYNEGAAIRYYFPENEKGTYYRIMSENTTFTMPGNTKAWVANWAQAPYKLLPLKDWVQESERPLTLQLGNGLFACLTEARMVDYARTKFKLSPDKPNTILTSMYTPADLISPFSTPWRVIMVGEKIGDLVENNHLILNLNPPSLIKDESWIKPGKIIRVMTQTTQDAKDNIDFAAKHGMPYILFDWKWYGPAFTFTSDVTKVVAPLDMPEIVRYGKEKGIGVWLYVNLQGLYSQSDSLFAVYHKWGIKGVKFGFVQIGSHRWTTWVEEMIKKAAENQIMVNIHDDWRPTGEQRTYPNLMTAEGIRGNEEMPDATHNTVLPFTRFIAGGADYTICYYTKRIKTTHAHQLALAAIYYSPIQTLYWYDKPAMSKDEPELSFWDKIPTTWDETKIVDGTPGEFVTTARRNGKDWFVGTITNNSARNLNLSFSFLPKGKNYTATIYSDDDNATTQTKVVIETKVVNSATLLTIKLKASGGQAIYLTPADK